MCNRLVLQQAHHLLSLSFYKKTLSHQGFYNKNMRLLLIIYYKFIKWYF